ncbi:hypothetical protein F5Y06DRAFT_47863 [Hypoxylon sp. FL0890]|nr:hypothetical protein F5Y06DRAFT_47863 [Hypoxylon sp. FL0890]
MGFRIASDPNYEAGHNWVSFQELMREVKLALYVEGRLYLFDYVFKVYFHSYVYGMNRRYGNHPIELFCWELFCSIYEYFWPGITQQWDIPREILEANEMPVNAAEWLQFEGAIDDKTAGELVDYVSFIEATLYGMLEVEGRIRILHFHAMLGNQNAVAGLAGLVDMYYSWLCLQRTADTWAFREPDVYQVPGVARPVIIYNVLVPLEDVFNVVTG